MALRQSVISFFERLFVGAESGGWEEKRFGHVLVIRERFVLEFVTHNLRTVTYELLSQLTNCNLRTLESTYEL